MQRNVIDGVCLKKTQGTLLEWGNKIDDFKRIFGDNAAIE